MVGSQMNVCVPMKVEAFRLNAASTNGPSRLAPLSQPDLTQLRHWNDVVGDVDLDNTAKGPALSNRVTNLTTGELRRERFGMYLHWILPRFYRTGLATTESSADDLADLTRKHGHPEPTDGELDPHIYRPLPPRWIVLRHLTSKIPYNANIPTFQAFVVESDRLSKIGDLGPDIAIDVDVSPSIYMKDEQSTLAEQAEMYIGHKQSLENWQEAAPDPSIVRVPLSILGNVNPVFADYQPHNTNVFSILDNFSYEDNGTKYLESATADYYVMGWHPYPKEDPFCPPQRDPYPTHAERLKGCYMQLAETKSGKADIWLKTSLFEDDTTKVLIHGALYQVEWDVQDKPTTVLADNIAKDYDDFSPVSVGVNPVDALLAITHARALSNDEGRHEDSKKDPLAQDVLSLQTLVIKQDEDPDAQLQAADMLYSSYFVPADGGRHWHAAGAATITGPNPPTVPGFQERKDLSHVNRQQAVADLCLREAKWMQWQIWAEWWKWVQSSAIHTHEERLAVHAKVNDMVHHHEMLISSAADRNEEIKQTAKKYNWETSTQPRFNTCRDPTVLLCGMKSGWPTDWSDLLKVRLDHHIVKMEDIFNAPPEGWDAFKSFASSLSGKLPATLQSTAQLLLTEFFVLQAFPSNTPHLRQTLPDLLFPLYHDIDNSETGEVWRDRWNQRQPWFPLFVEWEIEYYHIGHDSWVPSSRGPYGPPKLYFEIKSDADISHITDHRPISGRSLVLPHSNSMLKNMVEKLLKNKNRPKEISDLKSAIDKLDLLTLTLSSISGQLATKHQSTHLKPTINVPGYGPLPFDEAVDASKGVFDKSVIRNMYNTTTVPYGDIPDLQDAEHSPFKSVVHGQFRFTRLNVVDKFGQAVSALDPNYEVPPNLHPYISEFLACTKDNSSGSPKPLAVIPDGAQCVQLEPRINQESRLNGHYVLWSDDDQCWRPVTEYENPIWGWLVVNYVDSGLQVFLPDGTFYREIRLGGPEGTSTGISAWLPFEAPPSDQVVPQQLRGLMQKLRNVNYLQEFFDVMVGALDATMFTPNQYAGYLPAITGKPFALVNAGWSLQLSHPPDVNHSTSFPSSTPPEAPIGSYNFQIKLGDKDRSFDGLLGYFRETSPMEIDLDNFYTYFPNAGNDQSMTIVIEEKNYPIFRAFYNDPLKKINDEVSIKSPEEIDLDYNQRLQTYGILVDPFTLVHAYAGFLPVTTLQLPEWALEQSLKNITAFFHLGPMIMPNDAPPYDHTRVLASGSNLKNIPNPPPGASPYPVPAIGVADWAWLQPYAIPPVSVDNIHFNAFKLTAVPNEPKLERTPYTAVEGYLYLKQPITDPSAPPQDS